MDEVKYVLKCLALAAVLVALSQIKTNTGTIETQMHAALVSSETSNFVNKAAAGGAKLVRESWTYVQSKFEKKSHSDDKKEEAHSTMNAEAVQKAGIKKIELDQSTISKQTQALQQEDSVDDLIEDVQ